MKSKLKCEMIWKLWKKGKLKCEMIWKIWKKGKLKCEMIWKIWKKGKSNSEKKLENTEENCEKMKNMEERQVE
jgi:hypothetical protein